MSSSTDDFVPVGHVRRAHGLRGEVVVHSDSDHPDRFAPGTEFFADADPTRRLVVAGAGSIPRGVLVAFRGIDDRAGAEALRGVTLTIRRTERRPLDTDEFWPDDLVGASVVDPEGMVLGTVAGVVFGSAQDRIVVATPAGEVVEVPFVSAIVTDVSLAAARVVVDPPGGLFPG